MDEKEKITLKKYIDGLKSPKTAIKASAFLPWILLFLFLGYAVYNLFFPKPTQNQTIIAKPGSTVNVQQKQEEKKRSWWVPTPFVDIYSFVETNDRKGIGAKFGAHWEW